MATSSSIPWFGADGLGPYRPPSWLVRVRGVTAIVEAGVCGLVLLFPGSDLPLHEIVGLLLVLAAVHAAGATVLQRGGRLPAPAEAGRLLLEVLLLTRLLELTGGPFNPFVVVYVVQVSVTALTVGRSWAVLTGVASGVAYGWLVYTHLQPDAETHHSLTDFPTHLFLMWVAAAATAELAGYFLTRANEAIGARQREVDAAHRRAERSERVAALTTLAAGAAHELSTPLGTIAVAARELERATGPDARPEPAALFDDAHLIRTEVDRCRGILDQMSGRAGGSAADEVEEVALDTVARDVRARLPDDRRARLDVRLHGTSDLVALPRAGLVQVVASLVTNAFEASADGQPVRVEVRQDGPTVAFTVHDEGAGLTAGVAEHAGEPFFTTKEPGRGLGLGLFLARVFAERFGGSLSLESESGTSVRLTLPVPAVGAGARPWPPAPGS